MSSIRGVTALALVVAILFAPLAPPALAQQPPPAQVAGADVVTEMGMEYGRATRRMDVYDVGASVATAVRAPLNAATCVFGGAIATALFVLTFGSAYKASTQVIEEGCTQRWVIRGSDLRPRGGPSILDSSTESYGQERR